MTLEVVLRALTRDLQRASPGQFSRATLRVMHQQGVMSLGLVIDGAEHPPDIANFALFGAVERARDALTEPLRGHRRQIVIDLQADGNYQARVVEFVGGASLSGTGEAETVILDDQFRLPGQHHPHPIADGFAPSRRPTELATLTRVRALVAAFVGRYESMTGQAPHLRPGVRESDLQAAEATLGFRLPEDLRALYRVVAGEEDEIGLLGGFGHFTLPDLVDVHLAQQITPWVATASDPVDGYPVPEPMPPGLVTPNTSSRMRLVFATDHGGGYLAADLAPGVAGRHGQVIRFGSTDVAYLADSVTTMLADVVDALEKGWQLAESAFDTSDDYGPYLNELFEHPSSYPMPHRVIALNTQALPDALAELAAPDDTESGTWNVVVPRELIGHGDLPFVQELTVLGGMGPVTLSDLDSLHRLRTLTISAATAVTANLPHHVPAQALNVEAREVNLAALAGHPTLWSVTVGNASVRIVDLATLPNLCRVDLSAARVVDIAEIATLQQLRVLVLRADQWDQLRQLGVRPTHLAAVKNTGCTDFAEWANWLAPGTASTTSFTGNVPLTR